MNKWYQVKILYDTTTLATHMSIFIGQMAGESILNFLKSSEIDSFKIFAWKVWLCKVKAYVNKPWMFLSPENNSVIYIHL